MDRFQLIGEIAVLQIVAAVPPKGEPHALQQLRQPGQGHGRLLLRLGVNIQSGNIGDGGDLSDGLVHQHGERPPYPVRILLQQRRQLLAAENQVHPLILCLLRPHPHILGQDADISGPQLKPLAGLAAHPDIPVLPYRLRGLPLEVHQREQAGAKALRTEDQFILFAVEAQLKGSITQGRFEGAAAYFKQFTAALVRFVGIHDLAQRPLDPRKGRPSLFGALPEVFYKPGKGQSVSAAFDVLLGVLIPGACFQGPFKIAQGGALLIQKIISGSDPVIPTVIFGKMLLMRFQKFQSLFIERPSCLSNLRNGDVCLGQFAVQFRRALLGGDGLQRINHLLRFVLLEPLLALFQ